MSYVTFDCHLVREWEKKTSSIHVISMCSLFYTYTNSIARSAMTKLHLREKLFSLHFPLTHSSLPATNASTHPDNHLSTLPSLHPSPIVCLVWHFVCPSIVVHQHLERWITHPTVTEEAIINAQVLGVWRVHDSKLFAFFDVAFCHKDELAACIVVAIPDDWVARVVEPGCGQKDAARGTGSESGI